MQTNLDTAIQSHITDAELAWMTPEEREKKKRFIVDGSFHGISNRFSMDSAPAQNIDEAIARGVQTRMDLQSAFHRHIETIENAWKG